MRRIVTTALVAAALLVPALMRLAGGANWWAPPWMRRLHDRIRDAVSDEDLMTIHTEEATLEDIFVEYAGRGLA